MGAGSNYWWLVRVDAAGQRKVEEIAIAKTFFQHHFPDQFPAHCQHLNSQPDIPDRRIQQEMLQLWKSTAADPPTTHGAEWCLRCFISHEIEQVCVRLEAKFGKQYGITRQDLLPLVLHDEGIHDHSCHDYSFHLPHPPYPSYNLAREILNTFDPNQAGLSTWVARQVRQYRELQLFLLEHGVYLVSDWAILNDTTPKQLQRILTEFHLLTASEVEQACHLLRGYHVVYRGDRLQLRQTGQLKGKEECLPPSQEQLFRIAQHLPLHLPSNSDLYSSSHLSNDMVMTQLQTLATQLREYRIHVRGGNLKTESIDDYETYARAVEIPTSESSADGETEMDSQEFLTCYRKQFVMCLDQMIAQVTCDRVAYLECKDTRKVDSFLKALFLFHCQGQPMTKIAIQLGLKQFQVTRLLKLKEFRADIQQRLLQDLSEWVIDRAKEYTAVEQLQTLNQRVAIALNEQVSTVFDRAAAEAAIAKQAPLTSLFSRRVCHYLDNRGGAS
jgi:hypothetical protein